MATDIVNRPERRGSSVASRAEPGPDRRTGPTLKAPLDTAQTLCKAGSMFNAAITEFPFVETLPKREKTKLAKLWDHLAAVKRIIDEKGTVLPQHMVADLLDLSRSRIGQLIDDGRLEAVEIHGFRYVTETSVVSFAKEERKNGRPTKPLDNRQLWKSSLSTGRMIVENSSK